MNTINIYINDCGHQRPRLPLKTFGPVSEQFIIPGPRGEPMIAELKATQQADVTYGKPLDKKGNETTVEAGSVRYVTTDPAVASFVGVSEDPIQGTIVAVGPGACEVYPTADADLGEGVVLVEGERVGVHVTAGQAVGFGSPTVGAVVEQP